MDFKEVKISINGKDIKSNKFVASIIGNTIYGIVSSLRLDEEPKEIEIKVIKK